MDEEQQPQVDPALDEKIAQHEDMFNVLSDTIGSVGPVSGPVPDAALVESPEQAAIDELTPPAEPLKEFVIEGAKTSMPRTPAMKQAQTASNRAEKKATARTARTQRAGAEQQAGWGHLGKVAPPDLSDAEMVGTRDQGRDDIRGLEELSKAMDTYQNNLNRLLGRMQSTLIEAILHIETLENHWQRLK